jgi:splicing factor 3B subunit 3
MICDSKNSFLCRLNEKQDSYVDYNIKKINIREGINLACNCVVKNQEKQINENISLITQKKNAILGKIQHDNISPINIFKLLYNPKAIIPTLNNNFIILETFREKTDNDEKWNSCIQIVGIKNNECNLINEIKFENECILSYHLIENYYANSDKQLLIISTAENYKLYPIKKYSTAKIYLYDIFLDIKKNYAFTINLKFKDKVESLATAICEYQNKVLCGMYKELILYEIGKEHLLKKSRSNLIKDEITSLSINGDRILALTRRSSIYILKYNEFNALFYTIISDDFYTRYIHKVKFLDYDTVVGSDKFENFFIYRIPKDQFNPNYDSSRHAVKDSMTGMLTNSNDTFLHAASLKLVLINEIHLGEIITEFHTIKIKEDFDNNNEEEENEDNSMSGNNMNNSDDEMDENKIKAILYGTLAGGIGMLIQFNKKEDALFFAQMELLLREYIDEPTGRNILMAKSQYIPVKNIIDFNLIYEFFNIEPSLQKKIAEELGDKPIKEIKNKISEIKNLFQ